MPCSPLQSATTISRIRKHSTCFSRSGMELNCCPSAGDENTSRSTLRFVYPPFQGISLTFAKDSLSRERADQRRRTIGDDISDLRVYSSVNGISSIPSKTISRTVAYLMCWPWVQSPCHSLELELLVEPVYRRHIYILRPISATQALDYHSGARSSELPLRDVLRRTTDMRT